MGQNEDKVYCGIGRETITQHGSILGVSMSRDDIGKIVEWMKENKKDWVTIAIKERKEPKGDITHYCHIDTFRPKRSQTQDAPPALDQDPDNSGVVDELDDNLPF